MRNLIIASTIAALSTTATYADSAKAGPFIDFGITGSSYYSDDDYLFDRVVGDQVVIGGMLGGGYLWDIGNDEGWLIGVSGVYNYFGEVEGGFDTYDLGLRELPYQYFYASASAAALSVRANFEYSFGPRWSFGMFGGPAIVFTEQYDQLLGSYEDDFIGVTGGLAGMYSPTDHWTISLGAQITQFENDYDYRYRATTAFLTGRYSF
jgi:hypothetical protein